MATQAESRLSGQIVAALCRAGHHAWKVHQSAFSRSGLSDIAGVCAGGTSLALETKIDTKLTSAQKTHLVECARRGARAGVVRSVGDGITLASGSLLKNQMLDDLEREPVYDAPKRRRGSSLRSCPKLDES